MTKTITYMGTKRSLLRSVQAALDQCKSGALLDAFAGMGAVAEAVAPARQVWLNDVQAFSRLAARCRFTSTQDAPRASTLARLISDPFFDNRRKLLTQNLDSLEAEARALQANDYEAFQGYWGTAASSRIDGAKAFSCIAETYAFGYLGLRQAIEADSIVAGLTTAQGQGVIDRSDFEWGIYHLGRSILRVANTTGHFAQYLTPSSSNFQRVTRQLARSLTGEWLKSIDDVEPVADKGWRKGNRVTGYDSQFLPLGTGNNRPSVVYCDPPYTDDQYSRYYHLWETLVLYDYPTISGKGRYRPGRFQTDFSLVSKVEEAFLNLISAVREADADLVLSYPSNGLLYKRGVRPEELISEHYSNGVQVIEVEHFHSSLGASKGTSKSQVREQIFVAAA